MNNGEAINHHRNMVNAIGYLQKVHLEIERAGMTRKMANLIMLRISQINNCAFCVKMHSEDARKEGETNERLDRLAVFSHVEDFSAEEKAALIWAEALTKLNNDTDYQNMRKTLRNFFSDEMISAITLIISMINLWNRLGVSNH